MKFSSKTAGFAAVTVMAMSLATVSAFGDSRPPGTTVEVNGLHSSNGDNRYDREDRDDYDRDDRYDNDREDRGRYDRDGRYDNDGRGRGDRGWNAHRVAGVVEHIDFRRSQVFLRDGRSGRTIRVDMDRVENRRRSADLNDLRRGDFVRIAGQWSRHGFEAYRIEDVRSRRGRW